MLLMLEVAAEMETLQDLAKVVVLEEEEEEDCELLMTSLALLRLLIVTLA
jgi:hypothetical protein